MNIVTEITATEHNLKISGDPFRLKIMANVLRETEVDWWNDQTISDFIYNIETAYQRFHDLDEDDWDFTDSDKENLDGKLLN